MTRRGSAELGYLLKVAQHAVHKEMEDALRPTGLTLSQYAVLNQLDVEPGQTNAELARRAFITAQSMQGVLANMERDGLIVRRADKAHGRRRPAALTKAGRSVLGRARASVDTIERAVAAAVPPLTTDSAVALLERIRDRFTTDG